MMAISFRPVEKNDKPLILKWLHLPHVAEWFYGDGLQSTIDGLNRFINHEQPTSSLWLASYNDVPFAYLITSIIQTKQTYSAGKFYHDWVGADKKMITLDMLIGETDFLGKGLAVTLIHTFLKEKFPDNPVVFIDPECSNHRAVHVYKKAAVFSPNCRSFAIEFYPPLVSHFKASLINCSLSTLSLAIALMAFLASAGL